MSSFSSSCAWSETSTTATLGCDDSSVNPGPGERSERDAFLPATYSTVGSGLVGGNDCVEGNASPRCYRDGSLFEEPAGCGSGGVATSRICGSRQYFSLKIARACFAMRLASAGFFDPFHLRRDLLDEVALAILRRLVSSWFSRRRSRPSGSVRTEPLPHDRAGRRGLHRASRAD